MHSKPKITMQQIAENVGVSRSVVSKVLGNSKSNTIRVNPDTAARIRRVALELGFVINSAAKAVSTGRFNSISLLQSGSNSSLSILPKFLLAGIQQAVNEQGMHLVLSSLPDEKLVNEGFVPQILGELFVDGLLVNYVARIPEDMVKLIHQHRIPSIWLNSKQEKDCVYHDDIGGGVLAARHLVSLGHRKILFASFCGYCHYSVKDRQAGYLKVIADAGLEPIVYISENHMISPETGVSAKEILSAPDRPTAIICYTPKEFFAFLYTAYAMGLKVPEDLSLVSFDQEVISQAHIFGATVLLQEELMASKAVDMLIRKIAQPSWEFPPEGINCQFMEGNTTAPPKGEGQ